MDDNKDPPQQQRVVVGMGRYEDHKKHATIKALNPPIFHQQLGSHEKNRKRDEGRKDVQDLWKERRSPATVMVTAVVLLRRRVVAVAVWKSDLRASGRMETT